MSVVAIVIVVFVAIVLVLTIGGYVAIRRRWQAEEAELHEQARKADHALAVAHAEDKGWERSGLEAAARAAYRERHGRDPERLVLIQVVDRPGTDDDLAVFHADGERLVLGRRAGDWVHAG